MMTSINPKPNVFISTHPFGIYDQRPLDILKSCGINFQLNPNKRKLKPEEVAAYAQEADVLIAGTEDLTLVLEKCPKLRFISRVGIGLDSVPIPTCVDRGIRVSYTPDAVTMAVAELTLGLMLSGIRHVVAADREIRNLGWSRPVGMRIGESTVGIIGFGRVGLNVLRLIREFRPKRILVNDILDKTADVHSVLAGAGIDCQVVEKEQIFREANIISLHTPLNRGTKNMITAKELSLFRPDCFLINTARGPLVSEADLFAHLNAKKIMGAALDVYEREPYIGELSKLDNVILTQHMGSCSYDCRLQMEVQAAEEVVRFFQGAPLQSEVPYGDYL